MKPNRKSRIPHPASRRPKRPLSPRRALEVEIRTLNRACDKILAEADVAERQRNRRFERLWKALKRQELDVSARHKKDTRASEAAVVRALNQIESRRCRLQARLAAL